MRVELALPISLGEDLRPGWDEPRYFTFLIRQNTAPLSASQLASPNLTLALEFLNSAGQNQFDFSFHGQQQDYAIRSQADMSGQDVSAEGFAPDTTYLFVGKIDGNGVGANTMQASLFPNGSQVGLFTDPSFQWMLTANSSAGFNPIITQLQFRSLHEANYTVSNVWIGRAEDFVSGDFNSDGVVNAADYVVWRKSDGTQQGYDAWRANFGRTAGGGAADFTSQSAVPEPGSAVLIVAGYLAVGWTLRRIR